MLLRSESFVVLEWEDDGTDGDRPIAPLHVHHEDDEAWYVLEGRLGFRLGDEERIVGTGEGIVAPRGIPHSFWNAHGAPTRYLLVVTPRIHRLLEAIHAAERGELDRVFEEHASVLL
jgi:mannose-6-phosphate isomerase-like protein (cupin superfamily)